MIPYLFEGSFVSGYREGIFSGANWFNGDYVNTSQVGLIYREVIVISMAKLADIDCGAPQLTQKGKASHILSIFIAYPRYYGDTNL